VTDVVYYHNARALSQGGLPEGLFRQGRLRSPAAQCRPSGGSGGRLPHQRLGSPGRGNFPPAGRCEMVPRFALSRLSLSHHPSRIT
jgi:hypothetical protein